MDPFIAEIRILPYNFAPKNWAFCSGQILPISQNTALFSLLGTNFGGNGTTNFALPNLQGNVAVGAGSGPGLTSRAVGETGGSATVTLTQLEMTAHTHAFQGIDNVLQKANKSNPTKDTSFARSDQTSPYQPTTNQQLVTMSPQAVSTIGGNQAHNNMQPYLVTNVCIALQGVFPPRP